MSNYICLNPIDENKCEMNHDKANNEGTKMIKEIQNINDIDIHYGDRDLIKN